MEVVARFNGISEANVKILFDCEALTYEGQPKNYKVYFWKLSPCKRSRWYKVIDTTQKDIFKDGAFKQVATICADF